MNELMAAYIDLGIRIGTTATTIEELHAEAIALFRQAVAEGNEIILRNADGSDDVSSLLTPEELQGFSESRFQIAWQQEHLAEAVAALRSQVKAGRPITDLGADIDRVVERARETGQLRVLLLWEATAARLGTTGRREVAARELVSSIRKGQLFVAVTDLQRCLEAGSPPEELRPITLRMLSGAATKEPAAIVVALKQVRMESAGIPTAEQIAFAHCAYRVAFGDRDLFIAFDAVALAVGAGGSLAGLRVAALDVLKCAFEMGETSALQYVLESAVTPLLLSPGERRTEAYREYTLSWKRGDMDGAALSLVHALIAGTPLAALREPALAVAARGKNRFGAGALRYAAQWRASHPGTQGVAPEARVPAIGA